MGWRQAFTRDAVHEVLGEFFGHAGGIFATAGEVLVRWLVGDEVVAIQDSSDLVLGGRKRRQQGFGPVGKGGAVGGLTLHAIFAVDARSGEVLGLAGGQVWNRTGGAVTPHASRSLEDKELLRWITGAETAARVLAKAASITVVADRESDIYEDYARRPAGVHLLTRMHHNRCLVDGRKLHEQIDAQRPAGDLETVDIPAKPGHAARQAKLALRFSRVEVKAPNRGMPADALHRLPPSCTLWAIDIREVGAAEDHDTGSLAAVVHPRCRGSQRGPCQLTAVPHRAWTPDWRFFHSLKSSGSDVEAAAMADPGPMMVLAPAAAVSAVTVIRLD